MTYLSEIIAAKPAFCDHFIVDGLGITRDRRWPDIAIGFRIRTDYADGPGLGGGVTYARHADAVSDLALERSAPIPANRLGPRTTRIEPVSTSDTCLFWGSVNCAADVEAYRQRQREAYGVAA